MEPWDRAGLDIPLFPTGISSLVWAQLSDDPGGYSYNAFSWIAARNNYYKALTTGSESDWKLTFQALGQVMHLVADAAVPAHVRNDTHPLGDPYEKWAKEQAALGLLSYQPPVPVDPAIFFYAASNSLAPIPISALWDQDRYTGDNPSEGPVGLAEYTNAYFFSEDTVGPSGFSGFACPHPDKSLDTDFWAINWSNPEQVDRQDGRVDNKIYLRHTGAASKHRLLAASYWLWDCLPPQTCWGYTWLLDSEVYKDNASVLIPRAVGYSAALLDYFFRGRFDVRRISLRRDENGDSSGLELEIKNASELGSQSVIMRGGRIDLAYSYLPPGQTEAVRGILEGVRTVPGDPDAINIGFVPIEISFSNPIPSNAKQISFTPIYRGRLGGEDDGVAAKVIPMRSRIAYSGQPGCGVNPSHIYTIGPDGTDDVRVTDDSDGYAWRESPSWSANGKVLAFNGITSENRYEIVVVDLESDQPYPSNIKRVLRSSQTHYISPSLSPDGTKIVAQRLLMSPPPDENDLYNALVIFDVNTGAWSFPGGIAFWRDKPPAEQPKWSPRGDRIVFQALKGFQGSNAIFNIWTMDPAGTGVTYLTDEFLDSRWPAWSPDGRKVLFASKRDGGEHYEMWLMNAEGGDQVALTDWETDLVGFSFSPDGESIVIHATGGLLYTMNLDGTNLSELQTSGCSGTPEWSPYVLSQEVEMNANPKSIVAGGTSTLSWDAGSAGRCTIEPGIGAVGLNGSIAITPAQTTTYTITAEGPLGRATSEVTVKVANP